MLQVTGYVGLHQESFAALWVVGMFGPDLLERNPAPQFLVFCNANLPEAADRVRPERAVSGWDRCNRVSSGGVESHQTEDPSLRLGRGPALGMASLLRDRHGTTHFFAALARSNRMKKRLSTKPRLTKA
jgi:hypothetical protein